MSKTLTQDQRDAYVQSGGVRCPFCKSEDITAGAPEVGDHGIYQSVDCADCGAEWEDAYRLDSIILPGE